MRLIDNRPHAVVESPKRQNRTRAERIAMVEPLLPIKQANGKVPGYQSERSLPSTECPERRSYGPSTKH